MGERPERLSVSRLKGYTWCAEQYRLEKIEGTSRPPGAWTVLGTAFHKAYERWERDGREGRISDRFPDEYSREIEFQSQYVPLDKWEKRPRIATVERDLELYLAQGIKQADEYQRHCDAAEWKLWTLPSGGLALEVQDEWMYEDIPVRFTVDSILEWPDGKLTIRDLKTGKKVDDNRQIGFYRVFVADTLGVDISYGEYWYTSLNRSGGWVDLGRYTRAYADEMFRNLVAAHESDIYIPNPGKACDFCSVKEFCREKGNVAC